MTLRFDPLGIFQSSRTPAGLYVRRKWLGHEDSRVWKEDLKRTVNALLRGQSGDGSWGGSALLTVRQLFGLHLTVRDRTDRIEKGLHWLLETSRREFPRKRVSPRVQISREALERLPFSKGCSGLFLYGATLFLCSIFAMDQDERVVSLYGALEAFAAQNNGRWCGWSCSSNVFRAFVVHPDFSHGKVTRLAVKALSGVQQKSGEWIGEVPFYQTVNALAHLDYPEVERQLEAAFERLSETQNRDGTWGRSQREWKTFLIIHALKRKGLL